MPDRRMLLVHAHPDDESINNGATMARYVAEGAQVTLLTCTLGEEGEVLVPELAQLAADQADQLGGFRISELTAAMAALGVTDFRWLGGAGRYRDSGMMGTPANQNPRAFWNADLGFRPDLGEPWQVAKVYWTAMTRSVVQQGIDALARMGEASPFEGLGDIEEVPFVVAVEVVTAAVDGWLRPRSIPRQGSATGDPVHARFA